MPTDDLHDQAELPFALSSVREARSFVRRVLGPKLTEGALDTVELLTSEVVTNAVLHAGASPLIVVSTNGQTARVAVQDSSPRWPARRDVPDVALSGRGVALVDTLASSWGVERISHNGKQVWFEVRDEDSSAADGYAAHRR